LEGYKAQSGKKKFTGSNPFGNSVPRRIWGNIVSTTLEVGDDRVWAEVTKKDLRKVGEKVKRMRLSIVGKNTYKSEFTTSGGVR